MNWFTDLPTRAKLFLVFGLTILLFAVAIAHTYRSLAELVRMQAMLRDHHANLNDLAMISGNHHEGRIAVLMLLTGDDPADQGRWVEDVRRAQQENGQLLNLLRTRNRQDSYVHDRLREFSGVREDYVAARSTVLEHLRNGRMAEARAIALDSNNDRYLAMRRISDELIARSREDAEATLVATRETSYQSRQILLLVGLGVVAVSLFGVVFLGRIIASPLQDLLAAASRVSSGDLRTSPYLRDRRDEVGVLARSFASMVDSLRDVHAEIQEGVNVLASSASEISTATAEISASATETATAVSQTSTTVEEVKQTAQVSAQKAGHVADVAQKAAQSAQVGRKAVDESVEGMKAIREQMELIAETIVRLSEQSQAIGEIIESVNELAEQSNLLAVNASIEAAKAGEHGRGFAVVAQEIRSLAVQSKESTAQVRTILNDIQKATTAAVMAAEQGSKAVDAGVRQVNQSGQTIRALAESIVTAAQAATQITASSQQQLIGVDQVALAMQNILQASKQNAAGTQQAEAGARNLSELGQKLRTITQRFTV